MKMVPRGVLKFFKRRNNLPPLIGCGCGVENKSESLSAPSPSMRQDWDHWFMSLAHFIACRSRDPSTKVGAVIVRPDNTIASVGYNDFPRRISHAPRRYEDRTFKLRTTVHAEKNAIFNAREPLHGYSMYVTFMPCSGHGCASAIIQSGISKVYVPDTPIPERWREDMDHSAVLLMEAGVKVIYLNQARSPEGFNFVSHLHRQRAFSQRTFGDQPYTGVLAHIEKEIGEIGDAGGMDVMEWIDVILLACDGAMRCGHSPEEIVCALTKKLAINETRKWPDPSTVKPGQPIEHVKKDGAA